MAVLTGNSVGRGALAAALVAMAFGGAAAQEAGTPHLNTNEAYVEDVTGGFSLDVADPMAVFAFVFGSLPTRVKVYPTENYWYFSFHYRGTRWAGNIRIEPHDAGDTAVHFVYFQDGSQWHDDSAPVHVLLDASRGVTVEKVDPLLYRLGWGGRSVEFALNDLSRVTPPAKALAPGETFIGPIFDESAIRFFLVYDSKLKVFHYVLDDTVKVADEFFSPPGHPRIVVGKRTGFAFYRDRRRGRSILIGVFAGNYSSNTWFDGPFDQLPDNFIKGEALRRAILEVAPYLKGKIDRFGSAPDGRVRFEIRPYATYAGVSELYGVDACARKRLHAADYYGCFVAEDADRRGNR